MNEHTQEDEVVSDKKSKLKVYSRNHARRDGREKRFTQKSQLSKSSTIHYWMFVKIAME